MLGIRSLAEADAACGGKAHGLARAMTAGLHVPDGFVIEPRVFAEIAQLGPMNDDAIGHALAAAARRIADAAVPDALDREVRARAHALGRLAVRSSASVEDGALGAAAGVFESVTDVAPDDVWGAVRAVWTSALTPLAVSYARRHDHAIAIAVIVQRFVPGARVTVYTRPIGEPTGAAAIVQRGEQLTRIARADAQLALAAEAAIEATRGADVELVEPREGAPWLVQARPIVHPVRAEHRPPPPIVTAPLVADGRRWTWDITHNPDPLSPAQAGLVDAVDRAGAAPYAMRVCGGYLYTASGMARPTVEPPATAAELAARIAAIEARFALEPTDDLAAAVARYVDFVRIWAWELSPLIAAARRALLDRLARDGHDPAHAAARAAAMIGPRRLPRDRVMAPAWDVAVATFGERGAALTERESPPDTAAADAELALARAAADAAEHDDVWFARAQWLVRRALLAHAAARGLRDDDVFWLPLDERIAGAPIDPDDAHRRASAARAAHTRAAAWDMPLVIDAAAPREAAPPPDVHALHGVGAGPRVVGRVVRLASLAHPIAIRRGDVVVARAITPALAMVASDCAALVSETGGLLDHGAAMARELGIPCVVGCRGAWTRLSDGMHVAVDGDAGTVSEALSPGA